MLRIGTDCSGIEAPIQALKNLGIPFSHEFSSDIDKYCIQSIKANYEPKILFGDPDGPFLNGDITKRYIKDVPDIDLYVCGFPCQPFSAAGKRTGLDHKSGNVFWSCLDVIRKKRPKYFILENVKGLLSNDKGATWATIRSELNKLGGYTIDWKILNTKDYGIPQNRERLFIVSFQDVPRSGPEAGEMRWPTPVPLVKPLTEYVDRTVSDRFTPSDKSIMYLKEYPGHIFVPFNYINFDLRDQKFNRKGAVISPCITANLVMWCVVMNRYATGTERLMLQGFPDDFRQVVSMTQIRKQAGNSMSVNVIEKIIERLIL